MPKATFLEPTDPRTKASKVITLNADGSYTKESFPNLYKVTSHDWDFNTIEEFHNLVSKHAELGHVLLKGNVTRPLVNESRAGSTDAQAATSFVFFDVDGVKGINTPEEFIKQCLPPEFHDASYTWHPSSSADIITARGFSAHLSFLLAQPVPAPLLKDWLLFQNLTNSELKKNLRLSKAGVTLIYPLDVTTCQNDKLLYIANPTCIGFDDPIAERHQLVTKTEPRVAVDTHNVPPLRDLVDKAVNDQRQALGLKARKASYKGDILTNPEPTTFIESKRERGFVYGGFGSDDSTAYWFPEDNPRILRNFKGAPPMYLKDVDPVYYRQLIDANTKFLAFRDLETDTYYNGFYFEDENRHELHVTGSKDKLNDFMRNHGLTPPDPVPDWTLEFAPQENEVINFAEQRINTYQKTDVLHQAEQSEPVQQCPPTILRLITHMLGDNERTTEHFLNWLACVIQYRSKPLTAWVIHGIQGTGKGLFFEKVMQRILGEKYACMKDIRDLDDQFNSWLEEALLVAFDETDINAVRNPERTMATLKNLITEPTQTIRRMRTNPRNVPTHAAFLFYSNEKEVLRIDSDDRRFNVAPRQETRFQYTEELGAMIDKEVPLFAAYMLQYPADRDAAARVEETAAKAAMRNAGTTSVDLFFEALKQGNLVYFLQFANDEAQGNASNMFNFRKTLDDWCATAGKPSIVTRGQLIHAYNYLQNQNSVSPSKFERMLNKYGLTLEVLPGPNGPTPALQMTWTVPDKHLQLLNSVLA